MDLLTLMSLFVLLSALQPAARQRILEASRAHLIERLERQHGSRVILLVHRQETMSLLGFPLMRYLDIQDSEAVLRAIQLIDPEVPIDLVVHTPGGLVLASVQIARALARHKGRVRVFVPHYAMSGGTLLALAADQIVMCEHAVLGPLDPQIGGYPAVSLLETVARKPVAELEDRTLVLADQAEKALRQMQALVEEILRAHHSPGDARRLAQELTSGRWTHDYPLSVDEAKALGLPISTQMPDDILRLMALYPQPVRNATVEYLPERRLLRRSDAQEVPR